MDHNYDYHVVLVPPLNYLTSWNSLVGNFDNDYVTDSIVNSLPKENNSVTSPEVLFGKLYTKMKFAMYTVGLLDIINFRL